MKYFKRSEFDCKHCGQNLMVQEFMDRLDALRGLYGRPLIVSSGYRCPDHNARVSSTGRTGPHTTGRAADLAVTHRDAYELLALALAPGAGFTGVGINQKGTGRFIHLDDLPAAPGQPRPTLWSY